MAIGTPSCCPEDTPPRPRSLARSLAPGYLLQLPLLVLPEGKVQQLVVPRHFQVHVLQGGRAGESGVTEGTHWAGRQGSRGSLLLLQAAPELGSSHTLGQSGSSGNRKPTQEGRREREKCPRKGNWCLPPTPHCRGWIRLRSGPASCHQGERVTGPSVKHPILPISRKWSTSAQRRGTLAFHQQGPSPERPRTLSRLTAAPAGA